MIDAFFDTALCTMLGIGVESSRSTSGSSETAAIHPMRCLMLYVRHMLIIPINL
jgi:hypothetical protein